MTKTMTIAALVVTALTAACAASGSSDDDAMLNSAADSSSGETETVDQLAEETGGDLAGNGDVTADGVGGETVFIAMPPIPAIALPDISVLGATGDLVAEQLGDLITPVSGVDVVAADCDSEGGELVYQGSTGDDVFAIERDGSGQYYEESDDGLVTLSVETDGSGSYYAKGLTGLITIDVSPDGAGVYYHEQAQGLVTVERAADGSGAYYDDREGTVTVNIGDDGSGQYYAESVEELLTIDAKPDGTGQYYRKIGEDVTTIDLAEDGGWTLAALTSAFRLELAVAPDGSGRYVRTGLDPLTAEFDADGRAAGATVLVPERPLLSVVGRFPPLGKLGSLAPPCAAVLRFDASLLFEFNEAAIRPEASATLDEVAAVLIDADKPIEINGHTDSRGTEAYNLELSRRRAEAVEEALIERGLTTEIVVTGYGETQPAAPNEGPNGEDDPGGRAVNRRVEIVIRE
jgi:OOP family OmpA-OmpF porin